MSLFRRRSTIADRFLHVFAAHAVPRSQIPRLISSITYECLEDQRALLAAITPDVIDAVASLFCVRSQWLDGSEDLVMLPFGSRGMPEGIISKIADASVSVAAELQALSRGPLCGLTNSRLLDRQADEQQWVTLAVVEQAGGAGDGPIYRCHVLGDRFLWSHKPDRLLLKSFSLLVWRRLRKVVPLYEVSEEELLNVASGHAIPSVVFTRSYITNPSLEDYVELREESAVAKEEDELHEVMAYLSASGLEAIWQTSFVHARRVTPPPGVVVALAPPAGAATVVGAGGKRAAQAESWAAIQHAAQGIWNAQPLATYAEVIRRLRGMPLLKASALSESALRKRLAHVAPPGVRGKPGRPSNKSA